MGKNNPQKLAKRPTINREESDQAEQSVESEDGRFQEITFNLDSARVRHEILEGRNYTVLPMVMITEGVHAGSNGPLYYPASELSKTPAVWNHKPIVVYHPTENGSAVSACEPMVISRRKVGIIMNTKFVPSRRGEPGKLKAEAWLENDRLPKVDGRVASAVTNREVMEVSTGLFTDNELVEGKFGKKLYSAIARNYRPDHLALLPDEVGACSVKDGAGLMRNSKNLNTGVPMGRKNAQLTDNQMIDSLIENGDLFGEDDRDYLEDQSTDRLTQLMTANAKINTTKVPNTIDGGDDDNGETLEDGAGQVKGKKLGSKSGATKNYAGHLDDADDDERRAAFAHMDEEGKAAAAKAKKGKGKSSKGKMTDNQYEDTTLDDFKAEFGMENVDPAAFKDMVANGLRAHQSAKSKLIKTITANKRNKFTANQLAAKSIAELDALAALAGPVANEGRGTRQFTANYAGLGDAMYDAPTDNAEESAFEDEEPLDAPVMNFAQRGEEE